MQVLFVLGALVRGDLLRVLVEALQFGETGALRTARAVPHCAIGVPSRHHVGHPVSHQQTPEEGVFDGMPLAPGSDELRIAREAEHDPLAPCVPQPHLCWADSRFRV